MADQRTEPYQTFRFHVEFHEDPLGGGKNADVPLCRGAFSECGGLEATMEPKVIKEGGFNYGAHQRAGPVTFATVVLKRGITAPPGLWSWFQLVSGGAYAYRLTATITMYDTNGDPVTAWSLTRALPIKFKTADLNARATEVGIEELHLAHEGLNVVAPKAGRKITEVAS
jgi:phage tail-like protein